MKQLFFIILTVLSFKAIGQKAYQLQGNEVAINKGIVFKVGTADLEKSSDEALHTIKIYLSDKPYVSLLRIESHTDNVIPNAQPLSEKRALAICKRLVELGVDCKRLIAVGFGANKPIADNSTSTGKTQNNRISLVNVALRDRNIGRLPADGGGVVAGDVCKN
ncbi:OmpA family protein [Pedobacter frigiditerrae]|uniref:OmpA/MotB family protein n=1 Tax=Pedobacter frigiditerrae TaxID=2530452 RepID=UPI002930AC12|nr:OmpA family protein [Pedobacter frigiditerrae]